MPFPKGNQADGAQDPGDVHEARVAAEELVAAGPGQGHRHARVASRPAHEVGVDPVEGGLIDGREGIGELLLEGLLGEHDASVTGS